jgi:hypothetical protein
MPAQRPAQAPADPPSVEFISSTVANGNTDAAILLLAQHVAHLSSVVSDVHSSLISRVSKSEFRRGLAAVCGLLVSIFLLLLATLLKR